MEKKTLYLVSTRKFRAYVISVNIDEAVNKFKKWLDENNYGFSDDRLLASVEVIATENAYHPLGVCRGLDENGDDKLFL